MGHATGLVGVVGEDLGAACLQHCIRDRGGEAVVLRNPDTGRPYPVNTGQVKGPRLDRWIRVTWPDEPVTVFQAEIKSWSAHAIGGKRLSLTASLDDVGAYKESRWTRHWNVESKSLREFKTAKVLVPMKPPKDVAPESVRPLLIFWEALAPPENADDCFFGVDVAGAAFQKLWVFSVSGYLRSLLAEGIERVELEMPDAALRLRKMNRWFST